MPEDGVAIARPKIAKTIEFEAEQYAEIEDLWHRTRRPNFSEAVRLAVRHGLQYIRELEAEGKLVA
jgi:Arc/MetJ-type ribon-helix-helix transcriptional regulator